MNLIPLAKIIDDITTYYREHDYLEPVYSDKDFGQESVVVIGNEKRSLGFPTEEEYLFLREEAFQKYESDDEKETALESMQRYLNKNFKYLLRNIFYLDLEQFRIKRKYYIDEANAPVLKEILLRSVSHHERDLIVGCWLKGQVADDSYNDLVELSNRLYEVIDNLEGVSKAVRERWISALKLALRTDLANALVEMERMIRQIFEDALPFTFQHLEFPPEKMRSVYQYDIHQNIDSLLARHGKNTQETLFLAIYYYLQTVDFDSLQKYDALPPVELMKMKAVCEILYRYKGWKEDLPNTDKIDELTAHFISIDKTFQEQSLQRKAQDKERYQRKK